MLICPKCNSRVVIPLYKSLDDTSVVFECRTCGYNSTKEQEFCSTIKEILKIDTLIISRRDLIKFLARHYEENCITEEEIKDELLDIELYNQSCKKKVKK